METWGKFEILFLFKMFIGMCCIVVSSEKGLLVTSCHLQQDVKFVDYDVLHDADSDTSSPTQDHGGVIFHIFNNCLKPDYATVTRVFFHIFCESNCSQDYVIKGTCKFPHLTCLWCILGLLGHILWIKFVK